MFLLVSQSEQTIDFGEGVVRYRECNSADYGKALRDPRFRDPRTGEIDAPSAENEVVRSHLTGWEIKDANGKEIPFTPENIDFVMVNSTPHGMAQLRAAVLGSMREAQASGKD